MYYTLVIFCINNMFGCVFCLLELLSRSSAVRDDEY